jgi:hypothetical protein
MVSKLRKKQQSHAKHIFLKKKIKIKKNKKNWQIIPSGHLVQFMLSVSLDKNEVTCDFKLSRNNK